MPKRKPKEETALNVTEVEQVDVSALKPAEYNPRRISNSAKVKLRESISKFGFPQPIIANKRKGRTGTIISGHQRFAVAKTIGWETFPVVWDDLSETAEKELNLRLNDKYGEFDLEKLTAEFDPKMLESISLDMKIPALTDYEKQINAINNNNAETPIVPKFSEEYASVMIFCKNTLDMNYLRNLLGIKRRTCYKTNQVAECRVITVEEFRDAIELEIEKRKEGHE